MVAIRSSNNAVSAYAMGDNRNDAKSEHFAFSFLLWGEVHALKDRAHQVEENSKYSRDYGDLHKLEPLCASKSVAYTNYGLKRFFDYPESKRLHRFTEGKMV